MPGILSSSAILSGRGILSGSGILLSAGGGGPVDPVDPVVIDVLDGVYTGGTLTISGGVPPYQIRTGGCGYGTQRRDTP